MIVSNSLESSIILDGASRGSASCEVTSNKCPVGLQHQQSYTSNNNNNNKSYNNINLNNLKTASNNNNTNTNLVASNQNQTGLINFDSPASGANLQHCHQVHARSEFTPIISNHQPIIKCNNNYNHNSTILSHSDSTKAAKRPADNYPDLAIACRFGLNKKHASCHNNIPRPLLATNTTVPASTALVSDRAPPFTLCRASNYDSTVGSGHNYQQQQHIKLEGQKETATTTITTTAQLDIKQEEQPGEEEELETDEDSNFDYELVLTKILNEKKLVSITIHILCQFKKIQFNQWSVYLQYL